LPFNLAISESSLARWAARSACSAFARALAILEKRKSYSLLLEKDHASIFWSPWKIWFCHIHTHQKWVDAISNWNLFTCTFDHWEKYTKWSLDKINGHICLLYQRW
jgi:hypothetical protein